MDDDADDDGDDDDDSDDDDDDSDDCDDEGDGCTVDVDDAPRTGGTPLLDMSLLEERRDLSFFLISSSQESRSFR